MRVASLSAVLVLWFAAPAMAAKPASACAACSSGGCASAGQCAEASKAETAAKSSVKRSGSWLIEETENFCICRPVGYKIKTDIGGSFEALRKELCGTWLADNDRAAWKPKCHVVVHAKLEGYLKEVGPGGRQTTGSSLMDFDKDRVVMRRIDVRGDKEDWFSAAVAHELTHVVLADRFTHVQIPHWADEGMAILADTAAKQSRHGQDLMAAISNGSVFRLAELLTLDGYPRPARMGAFYGQSASVVAFLTRLGTRDQLVTFVDRATSQGYDTALREVYKIANVAELEHRWRRHLRGGADAREALSVAQPREIDVASGDLAETASEEAATAMVD